jgi:hypothetical protein
MTAPADLDALYHQPNWTPLADDAFRARVEAALSSHQWVCDGNYSAVHPIVRARASDIVWLDPFGPRHRSAGCFNRSL